MPRGYNRRMETPEKRILSFGLLATIIGSIAISTAMNIVMFPRNLNLTGIIFWVLFVGGIVTSIVLALIARAK